MPYQPASRKARLAVFAGGLAVASVGGVAYAAIPNSSTGVITGCRSTSTGVLRVIDSQAGQTCKTGEAVLSFNAKGQSLRPAGAWTQSATFKPGDIVTLDGSSYIAKTTNVNVKPPNAANWQVNAAKGDKGATGVTGPAGPQGVQVPQGPAGPETPVSVRRFETGGSGPITLYPGAVDHPSAYCPFGWVATGGGYQFDNLDNIGGFLTDPNFKPVVLRSYVGPNLYQVSVRNDSPENWITVTPSVTCVKGSVS